MNTSIGQASASETPDDRATAEVNAWADSAVGAVNAEELLKCYSHASTTETEAFWARIAAEGTPVWSSPDAGHVGDQGPDETKITFLWRAPVAAEHPDGLESVHVHVNRVTDKERHDAGYMTHVPGTDIWVLTLSVSPTLRASYGFTPLRPDEVAPTGMPEPCTYRSHRDPLNHRLPLVDHGPYGLSVLAGPQAPDQDEWESVGLRFVRGGVLREKVALPCDGRPRDHWLYLPPTLAEDVPLLTLFDAESWFGEMSLPVALDQAMLAGRLPEVAVLGISNIDRLDRIKSLGANSEFLRDVASTSVSWAQNHASDHGVQFAGRERRIVSGQSLGGLSALVAALEQPQSYGIALAHSSSLWWSPGGKSTPRDLAGMTGGGWITGRFADAGDEIEKVRIRLDVGTREGLTIPQTEILQRTLEDGGWPTEGFHLYDGGHDYACWRGVLVDGLAATLRDS
ncbi:MAG TPA: DUF3327 domain-containing protein [Candidatus Corynebacterium avicola]|uniref:DUF3327 domain-containing protein n=1 Tax=Candidatus Corynebacterium avicola TaxID=2838527 RepID=A0A9D1RSS4_9CORY|nr:DUF3327 domain-containing protein [Candidatus Corynebacterium avicola]